MNILKNLFYNHRLFTIIILIILIIGLGLAVKVQLDSKNQTLTSEKQLSDNQKSFDRLVTNYRYLNIKLKLYRALGADTTTIEPLLVEASKLIYFQHNFSLAKIKLVEINNLLDTKLNEKIQLDRHYGNITGLILGINNSPLSAVDIFLLQGSKTIDQQKSSSTGIYNFSHILEGTYSIKASLSGYNTSSKDNVNIEGQKITIQNITLNKFVPVIKTTSPKTSSSSSPYASYAKKTVTTSRGAFTVSMVWANLDNQQIKIVTDTASTSNCQNNCPVRSVSSYYNSNNGVAAINGTYFCPSDYAACAGQTGTYFWRVFNSKVRVMLNASNSYTDVDPIFVFDNNNKPYYYHQANSFGSVSAFESSHSSQVQAAIAGAELVYNNQVSLNIPRLDDKQKNTKSNRGSLGVKGNEIYLVVSQNATVIDSAYIMQALGMNNALNLDGGGSSALMYSGSYKLGPGRAIPNAIIIAKR